jgi:hypothetical protein
MAFVVLAVSAAGFVLWMAPAAGAITTTNTAVGSYSDPRNDLPTRSGSFVRSSYGPFVVPANGAIHNQLDMSIPPPCTNCYITDIAPNLVSTPGGATENLDTGGMLHHFVMTNPSGTDTTCPGTGPGILGERIFASGNERTHMHLPSPYGYYQGPTGTWTLVTHVVNKSAAARTVYIEVTYRYTTSGEKGKPMWLDIDGMSPSCGDSDYTIPATPGYSDTHQTWTSTIDGRIVSIAGHLHDVDITGSGSCVTHCPAEGGGIAVSAELVGGPATDYFGPSPPGNPPPSDLTGATICRSEAHFGTAWAGGAAGQWKGHLDTVGQCGIFNEIPGTAQTDAYPPGAAFNQYDGYPIKKGQGIRLHSEYQNDTGFSQIDVMGIMMAFVATPDPYPRPKGATPLRASLVPAYNQCTAPNRTHGPSLVYGSCNPPVGSSSNLTIGSPDANAAAANMVGSVRYDVQPGNAATTADEADVKYTVSVVDVRCKAGVTACGSANAADGADYTGQVEVNQDLRITDRYNGPSETGTVQDTTFPVTVPCITTADTAIGGTCSIVTTADAVVPGTVKETRRSIWRMGQVYVNDGGPDGLVSTTSGNTLFLKQGLFVP